MIKYIFGKHSIIRNFPLGHVWKLIRAKARYLDIQDLEFNSSEVTHGFVKKYPNLQNSMRLIFGGSLSFTPISTCLSFFSSL